MNGYTVCSKCVRVVKVKDGKLTRHVPDSWADTCEGFKTDALWVESNKLNAMGRNPDGYCMRCYQHVDKGPNLDCHQCCYERRHDCLRYDQKVKATVDRLRSRGAKINVRRRKVASGWKTYLRIRAGGTLTTWISLVLPLVRKDFPEAYMTSGAFTPEPWASDPHMCITVSLDSRSN